MQHVHDLGLNLGLGHFSAAQTESDIVENGHVREQRIALEYHSCITLIWREDHEDIRAARSIRVAKNKEGRTGKWNMNFDGMHQRFGWDTVLEDMDEARWPERNNPLQPRGADIRQESFYEISGEDEKLPF